jgi:hypothetical protein
MPDIEFDMNEEIYINLDCILFYAHIHTGMNIFSKPELHNTISSILTA